MRGVHVENFGYIANFWSDGQIEIKGDAMSGRTYSAMKEAAVSDKQVADRLNMYIYRVPEELYDFKTDPDALNNLINVPEYQEKIKEMKGLLLKEMKRTKDPIYDDFVNRFINY